MMKNASFLLHISYLLLLVLGFTSIAYGQSDELNRESLLIEAGREKLLGNTEKALALYQQIIDSSPSDVVAPYEMARIYLGIDEAGKALPLARRAAQGDPTNPWFQILLANTYEKLGQLKEAAGVFETLAKTHPQDSYFSEQWAFLLVKAGDITGALRAYDDLERRIGITEDIIRRKQTLYLGIGDTKKAAREIERLIEAFPKRTDYQYLLAEFYQQIGDAGNARKVYQAILDRDPQETKAALALIDNKPTGNAQEVQYIQSLQPLFADRTIAIDLKINKIIPLLQQLANSGDTTLARPLLDLTTQLEQAHPRDAKPYAAAGDILFYAGQPAQAAAKYQRALQLDDTVFPVWDQLILANLAQGDLDAARRHAENAMDIFPNKAVLFYYAGQANALQSKWEKATADLEQAQLMAGRASELLPDIESLLAWAYANTRQDSKAQALFASARQRNPKSATVLARQSLATQNADQAMALAQQARQLEAQNPEAIHALAWAQYRQGQLDEAQKSLQPLLKGANPLVLEHYGDMLFRIGQTESAIQYWNQARNSGSINPVLVKKITDKQLHE
ncbi:MAG: tetratricopeptide repeat protein [Lewinellaceae bacterium]|nr:tetratricopeptide repeat protein [Lewinellaceae bacterium]